MASIGRSPLVPRSVPLVTLVALLTSLAGAAGGCARTRVVTISAVPRDATIRVEGRDRGQGPITETFTFTGDIEAYRVQAERQGYGTKFARITPDSQELLELNLQPLPRRLTFRVSPLPAVVKLDGKPLSPLPVTEVEREVQFRLDPSGRWETHKVTAQREGFRDVEETLRFEDQRTIVPLNLAAMHKELEISTNPPGADVYINDEFFGRSPVQRPDVPFPVDPQTQAHVPLKVRIEKPGYARREEEINWDGGKINYDFELQPQEKTVRIRTEPPGATVVIDKLEIKPDAEGVHSYRLAFSKLDDKGEPLPYNVTITKARTADQEWESIVEKLRWDNGKQEYLFKLPEVMVRRVPMLRVRPVRANGAWTITAEESSTLAMKDEADGAGANKAVKITRLPRGARIDSLAVSPDGSQLAFTTLTKTSGELRSQIVTQKTEGTPDTTPLTDGLSLEITPAYTPDGSQIVFASNRGGRRLSIWAMPATERPVPERLSGGGGESTDLWPSVDSNPKPRLFYQALVDTRAEPRLFVTQLGAATIRDLTAGNGLPAGATQPRVAPTADAVVFAVEEKTGKRDIYRMSDAGRDVTNLTNTPDADEFDPAWSPDGSRVAYASDGGQSAEAPDNYDLWVIDAAGGSQPARVTTNGSWDDCPAWDAQGRSLYFRSNRGGEWNVWRIELK